MTQEDTLKQTRILLHFITPAKTEDAGDWVNLCIPHGSLLVLVLVPATSNHNLHPSPQPLNWNWRSTKMFGPFFVEWVNVFNDNQQQQFERFLHPSVTDPVEPEPVDYFPLPGENLVSPVPSEYFDFFRLFLCFPSDCAVWLLSNKPT